MAEETPKPRELTPADQEKVREAYAALRERLPGFLPRRTQARMVGVASRALGTSQGVAVIEAPTGTGKSLGYLSAAVPLARSQGRKVILSTATVALQEQLVNRDIPAFLKATGIDARVSIAKGRQRYACTRNLFELAAGTDQHALSFGDADESEPDFEAEALWPRPPQLGEVQLVQKLGQALSNNQWDGDLDTAPEAIPDELRPLVTTTAGGCSGARCPYVDQCPFIQARRALEEAEIVVANHALVLADLQLESASGSIGGVVLPSLENALLVVDEGHRLAGNAIEAGASHLHLPSTLKRLAGWAKLVAATFRACGVTDLAGQSLPDTIQALQDYAGAVKALQNELSMAWQPDPKDKDPIWRAPMGRIPEPWSQHALAIRGCCGKVGKALGAGKRLLQARAKEKGSKDPRLEKLMRQVGIALEQLRGQYALWHRWAVEDDARTAPTARWLSLGSDAGVVCNASPVTAAPLLQSTLWAVADGCVITSATLSAGGDFSALARELGLPAQAISISLPSPFDLPALATCEVPWLTATPDQFDAHVEEIVRWLTRELDWAAGSLVLFTSRKKMHAVCEALPEAHRNQVRMQGSMSRERLVAQHIEAVRSGQGSVLFGLASFGEGLDLPGELATTVVVTQLPFAVPSEPTIATAAEWVESLGRNPFVELTIPETIRTLTQYCGRLVRGPEDRGRIVVLDKRLVSKRYGATILQSLPPFTQRITRRPPAAA